MRKLIFTVSMSIYILSLSGQVSSTMYTSGDQLFDVCGNPVVLRGVNHSALNWGWDNNYDVFDEIQQTGANCVRIPWYTNPTAGGGGPAYGNIAMLDSVLTRCARHQMIPIMDLHDETCNNSPAAVLALTSFYTSPAMVALINEHKAYLIINFVNEALYVNWGGSATTFRDTYYTVIDSMRAHNIHVPIMIDASDCGTHLDLFSTIGNQIKMHDPDTNIIFSGHAYWYAYANNMDSVEVRNHLQTAVNTGLPFVLGELANRQSDGVDECFYTLNYKPLLNICQEMNIAWLAWSWDNDVCGVREMSSTGNFANLTTYGNDIVNNPNYGLIHSIRSPYLVDNFTCTGVGINNEPAQLQVRAFRLYENLVITNTTDKEINMEIFDLVGRKWMQKNIQAQTQETFSDPFTGVKIIRFTQENLTSTVKIY